MANHDRVLLLDDLDEDSDSSSSESENEVDLDDMMVAVEEADETPIEKPREINFDPSLPTSHSYLGTDLDVYSGRTLLDDDSYLTLPLYVNRGVVLFPGQTLPLQIYQQTLVRLFRLALEKHNRTFAMVNLRYVDMHSGPTMANVGTTAEIYSVKIEEEAGIETMKILAMGRQRFKMVETRTQTDGVKLAKVQILSERTLPDFFEGACLDSCRKANICFSRHTATTSLGSSLLPMRKKKRFSAAHLTSWPSWVYEQYDTEILMDRLKLELVSWFENSAKLQTVPKDPTDFSYWIASVLPMNNDDGIRLHLLAMNSVVQRLRCELNLMQKCTILCCKECGQQIALKTDVFCMSLNGPMAAYVNPMGYVHETLTVYRTTGLNHIGHPSTEQSWFPGYAWTICQCRHCAGHVGWRFTATKKKMKPDKFWGLTRQSLLPGLQQQMEYNE